MTKRIKLTDEKFQEIFVSEKFRNEVASAHQCTDKNGTFKYLTTCSYPTEYIVSEEQVKIAKREKDRAIIEKTTEYQGKLVLIGMGMDYESRYEDDVCNYRVRAHFLNSKAIHCFIECGTLANYTKLRIDHAIYDFFNENEINNYKDLDRDTRNFEFKKSHLLKIVNEFFDCKFKELVVDSHTIPADHISVSPI